MSPVEIGENVWVFRSRFAEMLSTLIALDRERTALVDPPMFTDEARRIEEFAEREGLAVAYLIITHAHGDHAYGMVHFPEAELIAHESFWRFWEKIREVDREFFARFVRGFTPPEIRPPDIVFKEEFRLRSSRKLILRHTPGHSPDGLLVELPEERVWIAGDTLIPIPLISSGSLSELLGTIRALLDRFHGETIVPGHGTPLEGKEARSLIEGNIRYLEILRERVSAYIEEGRSLDEVLGITPEELGMKTEGTDAIGIWIHRENLKRAYEELSGRG